MTKAEESNSLNWDICKFNIEKGTINPNGEFKWMGFECPDLLAKLVAKYGKYLRSVLHYYNFDIRAAATGKPDSIIVNSEGEEGRLIYVEKGVLLVWPNNRWELLPKETKDITSCLLHV